MQYTNEQAVQNALAYCNAHPVYYDHADDQHYVGDVTKHAFTGHRVDALFRGDLSGITFAKRATFSEIQYPTQEGKKPEMFVVTAMSARPAQLLVEFYSTKADGVPISLRYGANDYQLVDQRCMSEDAPNVITCKYEAFKR